VILGLARIALRPRRDLPAMSWNLFNASLLSLTTMFASCASHPPLPTEPAVDLERFMGDWYVQGHVPTSSEKNAYNAVESYALDPKRRILTTYAFRDGGFDADVEVMKPTGKVVDEESNAEWRMRFYWLFSAEYLIAYVDDAYSETIVGRTKRDYAWIMTREPEVDPARYARLVERLAGLGYDISELRRVPQRWPDPGHPVTSAGPRSLAEATRR